MTLLPVFLIVLFITSNVYGFVVPKLYQNQQTALRGDFFDDVSEPEPEPESPTDEKDSSSDEGRLSLEELEASLPEWDTHVPKFINCNLVGRVGGDPNPRYFDNGKVVLNLSLAVRRKYSGLERKAMNIQEDATDWYNLEMWGKDAEYASKYVTKGARVGVNGPISVDTWNDRETGAKRQKVTIIVRGFDILESKGEAELRRDRQSENQYGQSGNQYGNEKQSGNQYGNEKQSGNQYGNGNGNERRSFYKDDEDDDDDDDEGGSSSAGTGGFF